MDIDIDSVRSWLEVAAILGGVFATLWRYERRLSQRLDRQDALAEQMKAELDKQFGGNGGGMREAINSLQDGQAEIGKRLDRHLEQHERF